MSKFTEPILKFLKDGKNVEVREKMIYYIWSETSEYSVEIHPGFVSDGVSVPLGCKYHPKTLRGWLVHDYIHKTKIITFRPRGTWDAIKIKCTRFKADCIFLEAMKVSGVWIIKRWVYFVWVRLFGWIFWHWIDQKIKIFFKTILWK